MGRSPSFTIKDVILPEFLPSSEKLSNLNNGQIVKLITAPNNDMKPDTSSPNNDMKPALFRSISTYGQQTSSTDTTLIVDDINFCDGFKEFGIGCIVFRDPNIPIENHMYAWCVTTDGYIREIEHYGIIGKILDVEIIEEIDISNLSDVIPGQKFTIEIDEAPHEFVVDWIRDGLIALRDPLIPVNNDIYPWYFTTDGMVMRGDDIHRPIYQITGMYSM